MWTSLLLIVALPATIFWSIRVDFSVQFLLSCAVIIYSGWRLTDLAFKPKQHFLQLTFWLFVYCWFGLAASVEIAEQAFPWPAWRQTPDDLVLAEVIVVLGCTAYEIGVRSRAKRRHANVPGHAFTIPSCTRYSLVTFICIAVSALSIYSQGGLDAVLTTRAERTRAAKNAVKSEALIAGTLQHAPPMIALLATIYLLLERRYRRSHAIVLIPAFLALVAANCVANYPPSLPRFMLGSYAVAILLLLMRATKTLKPGFVVFMALALTIVFPYTDYFRTDEGYTQQDLRNPAETLQLKADYDAFQMLGNTVSVVQDRGVDYGYHILGCFLFFVPRRIWPDKPTGTGEEIGSYVGYTFLNLSSPLWAELDYAGGLLAVSLGFFLYGRLTRKLEGLGMEGATPGFVLMAYLAGFQIFLLRGDLMNGVAFSLPSIIMIFFFILKIDPLLSSNSKERRSAGYLYAIPQPHLPTRGRFNYE